MINLNTILFIKVIAYAPSGEEGMEPEIGAGAGVSVRLGEHERAEHAPASAALISVNPPSAGMRFLVAARRR